ncbi:response regulator [Metabacillus litoralis]|uniref:response regulator n=1 Tax=Metabacillus litoralis TaxID=152268 RepID=UPI00203C86A1|nr:response regulator [Metabacillus litoralis]MCM3412700.1 response regulator [Metabacillus litoralis]
MSKKILFVDDNLYFHKRLQDILNKIGDFEIKGFENGIDLIEHYKNLFNEKVNVDLIFIDFILRDMSSFEVLEEIMDINKNAVVILMGGGHKEDVIRGIRIGAKWFISKSLDEENLKCAIQRCIDIK